MFDRYLVRLGITSALTGILALIAMAKSPAVRTISPAGGGDAFLAHVSTDKPIYRAGERVYVRGVVLNANDHKPLPVGRGGYGIVQVTGPKGEIVASSYSAIEDSVAAFNWEVPDGASGGQYTAKMEFPSEGFPPAVRKFEVREYRAPRLKGEIIFLRDGFGPGDVVRASMHVERAEGGIPSGANVTPTVIVDGQDVKVANTTIDASGNCGVEFKLPTQIETGDGTLALAVADGGVVEPITKTIPILVKTVELAMYPEGGELIAGIPSRVYIEARLPSKKPADLVGSIVDSRGNEVATLKTEHEGRGRFTFTPAADEKYVLKISQPAGIAKTFALPAAKKSGLIVHSETDITKAGEAMNLQLISSQDGDYTISLAKRETEIASLNVKLVARESKTVTLTPPAWADGVLVATVKDEKGTPISERLVFRAAEHPLSVSIEPDKKSYVPGESATLKVKTTDHDGNPIGAVVGITVSDESVAQMIEKRDRAPKLAAMVLLENDVKELADADVYLDPKNEKGPLAVDLLLGTQGWRRFATADEAKFLRDYSDDARRALAKRIPVPPASSGRGFGGGGVNGAIDEDAVFAVRKGAEGFDEAADRKDVQDKLAPRGQAAGNKENVKQEMQQAKAKDQFEVRGNRRLHAAGGIVAAEMPAVASQPVASPSLVPPPIRIYAHDVEPNRQPGARNDFTETLYWCAGVKTDAKTGVATVSFKLNDSVTSFNVSADAFDDSGSLGGATASIVSKQPFYVEAKMPLEVTTGDTIKLPIAAVNGTDAAMDAVKLAFAAGKGIDVGAIDAFALPASARERRIVDVKIGDRPGTSDFTLDATAGSYADHVTRRLLVKPLGFPTEIARGGMTEANGSVSQVIDIPDSLIPGSIHASVALYPTPAASLTEALERLLQEPSGCFEQTTSTTYPTIMAGQYFTSHTGVDPKLIARCNELLTKGYDRLKGFECKNKGYEWFGEDPGHECLSAYGLMEFTDMSAVRDVDKSMIDRTRAWVLARRDGKGEFTHERRALHTWAADPGCSNGYITWTLLECGEKGLDAEVNWLKQRAATDANSYVTALAANALFLAGERDAAKTFMDKLATKQDADGHVKGATTTVVGSSGESLEIETTSLATLAWLRDPSYAGNVEKGIHFLVDSCKGGRYGSTQSTVLALRAIVAYDKSRAHPAAAGKIQLLVDGHALGDALAFDSSTQGALKLPDVSEILSTPGKHTLELKMTDGAPLPYAMAVSFNSLTPASSDACKLSIETKLKDAEVAEGAVSEAKVTVTNRTDETIPTPIAIVGLPGGLEVRHEQLKELVKAQRIAAYEVRGREVVLYWRDMQPKQVIEIPLSVTAAVPGTYTGPASRGYLYYTDEHKQWVDGMNVTITAK